MLHGLFGRFGGSSPLLLLDGSYTSIFGVPLFFLEILRPWVEVVGQKVALLLGRFGGVTPLHLDPAAVGM